MKKLVMIGGAMGTGKTAAAEILVNSVPNSVMLDGDWCWQQGCDWRFDQESRDMALRNIICLLESFLGNSHIRNVFFAWVLHLPEIHGSILNALRERGCEFALTNVSLTVDEPALRRRLEGRARAEAARLGLAFREDALNEQTARAMDRARCYARLDTIKIDTSPLTPRQVAGEIARVAGIEMSSGAH